MIGLWMLLGGLLALLNALTRWWSVRRLRTGKSSDALPLTLGGMVVRLAFIGWLFIAALRHGVVSGLAAFCGLMLVRSLTVIWAHTRSWSWPSGIADADGSDAPDLKEHTPYDGTGP